MKTNLIRLTVSIVAAFLFVFILLYYPQTISEPSAADVPKQIVKVSVKYAPATPAASSTEITEVKEETDNTEEIIAEPAPEPVAEPEVGSKNFEETDDTESFIGGYLDIDSVSEKITLPEIDLNKVYSKIVYPASLRRKNIEASIHLRVYVDKNGNITLQFPDGTHSAFISSIEKAFKGIKAKPAVYNDKATDVTFTIPIIFELK